MVCHDDFMGIMPKLHQAPLAHDHCQLLVFAFYLTPPQQVTAELCKIWKSFLTCSVFGTLCLTQSQTLSIMKSQGPPFLNLSSLSFGQSVPVSQLLSIPNWIYQSTCLSDWLMLLSLIQPNVPNPSLQAFHFFKNRWPMLQSRLKFQLEICMATITLIPAAWAEWFVQCHRSWKCQGKIKLESLTEVLKGQFTWFFFWTGSAIGLQSKALSGLPKAQLSMFQSGACQPNM